MKNKRPGYAFIPLYRIREILNEIEDLEKELDDSSKAWEDGTDPFAMAACDPSDQFEKNETLSLLKTELKELVKEI